MGKDIDRREFVKAVGAAAALSGAASVKAEERAKRVSAGEKVNLGIIGLAGRGFGAHCQTFGAMPDVNLAAMCDVYPPHLDRAVQFTGGKAQGYHDFRKLLEQKDLDAVVVATPPHWHPIISIMAMQAGKDVYCEKPMSRYPVEAQRMAQAARKYKRVTQVGTQIHATENYHRCVDIVRSGALGSITAARVFCTMDDNSEGLGYPANTPPLQGLDWEFWLGPAPEVPFNIGRFRDGMHRYFKDYVNSWLHELGPHIVDLPVWALKLGQPLAVSAGGGRYATTSIADVPDTLDVVWEYPNMNMTWTLMQQSNFSFGVDSMGQDRQLGISFHGKEATLLCNYGVRNVIDRNGKPVERTDYPVSVPDSPGHWREFIDCIKSRSLPSCNFEADLPLHVALNLAHTALYTGRKIHWDAARFEAINDHEANRLIHPPYRSPWRLPDV